MSRKQEIYSEMLRYSLAFVSNHTLALLQYKGLFSKPIKNELNTVFEIAELVHNMPVSVLVAEFTDHDFWLMNFQVRTFCEKFNVSNADQEHINTVLLALIRELFQVIPSDLRHKLVWDGP